jgi:hypothetical protein
LLGPSTGDATLKTWLCVVLDNEANTLMDQDQPEKARPLLDLAAALFRRESGRPTPAGAAGPEREARSEALWDLARVLRALKLPTEASQVDAERIGVWSKRPPDELVTLALKETSRAVLIGYGRTTVSERAKAVRKRDLDEAAGNLLLAIARGFKGLSRLKAHPDAQFLFSRDDLKSAIAGLESSERPSGSQTSNHKSMTRRRHRSRTRASTLGPIERAKLPQDEAVVAARYGDQQPGRGDVVEPLVQRQVTRLGAAQRGVHLLEVIEREDGLRVALPIDGA